MARKLIEKYRRRPDFDAARCTAVRLADGCEWYLPRPWLEITPVFRDGAAVARNRQVTCGPELDLLIESIGLEEDPGRQVLAVMSLGAFLILRNYDLDDDELSRLFRYRVGSDESEAMIKAIVDVATGKLFSAAGSGALRDPKASAVGSASR